MLDESVQESTPDTPHGTLVGRSPDLARFDDFVTGIPEAGGSVVLLGEPGVGKTALLDAAAARAAGHGLRVLRATGVQYRSQTGWSALVQMLTATPELRAAVTGTPVLAAALGLEPGIAPGPDAVAEAVVLLLKNLSTVRPGLLVLDDVQWLDRSSAAVLERVARRLAGTGTGLVCAARPGEPSFFDHAGLPVHELGPLSPADAEELLTHRFPALAARVRRRLVAEAEGNPLALLELPAALTDPQRTAAAPLPQRIPLTQRLQAAFAARIESLPALTRHLLLVAALEGSGNLQVVRRAVAGRCGLKHLAPAERVQLVHIDDATGRLAFRHSLIRSAVVDLAASDQRRSVHRALAEAWIGVPEQRAWHLARASIEPDAEIAALLEEAAEVSARRGDGPNAAGALVRAAELSPTGAERARLLARAAYVGANLTGSLREVPRLLEEARRADPAADSLPAAMAAAVFLLNSYGDVDTAFRLLGGAVAQQRRSAQHPAQHPDAAVPEALATLLMVCVYGGRPELWAEFDALAAGLDPVPDTLHLMRTVFGDPARARGSDWERLDAAAAALTGERDPVRILKVATACAYGDRLHLVDEPLRRTAAGGSRGDNILPAIQALSLLSSRAWFSGQWPKARRLCREALDLCEEFDHPLRSWTANFTLGCVSAACGEFDAARLLADRMDQWAGARRAEAVRRYAAQVRATISLARGEFEQAYRHLGVISPPGTLAPFVGQALWVILDAAEAAVRTGRREQALSLVAAARAAGLHTVSPRLEMVVLAAAGLAAEDDGEAGSRYREALAVDGTERWPFEQARIRLYYGERLRRTRAPARAREHLTAAVETFDWLGAAPWAVRARVELRACGEAAHGAGDRGLLTPQQWEIARLAARGLSNKQIGVKLCLSPRTVSTHLYQLFPKLGVTSRAALRDALEQVPR
ncbi:LuxR family transcriptional regulator [Kitasatospora purpeofusca]|uniref:helix-turn-helix transcriptional regulator n=1 Tax=Kitasatospora purpeofusca TaxID=67352 RepID=UPI002250DA8B|nr:LuxR family transcriptional regulator [Kitasatospora purpeofusca]MCX4683318.1 LuxR family transcriptional regulator [Kitasatospora purpeofusca]